MNKEQLLFTIAIICLLAVGITSIVYSKYYVSGILYANLTFSVSDHIGLSIDTDGIHLGMMQPGAGANRDVVITNLYNHETRVEISVNIDHKEWVSVSEPVFILDAHANKTIGFAVNPPDNAPFGDYTGYAKIVFKRTSLIYW